MDLFLSLWEADGTILKNRMAAPFPFLLLGVHEMQNVNKSSCPDCETSLNRREFVQALGGAALAAGALPNLMYAAPKADGPAETAAGNLYKTLTEEQRKTICFPFDHNSRKTINANWHVTKPGIGTNFYTKEQQALIHEVVKSVSSEDGYERFLKQMEDDSGGIRNYSVGLFGEPGTGEFQWLLTGRHLTMRADGDSVKNAAFGGPIVYGHGQSDPKKNLFHYQTQKANEVFKALDEEQRKVALLEKKPKSEADVLLQGPKGRFQGIAVGELSSDQQELVESVIKVILAPYRKDDVDEALEHLKTGGGLKELHLSFYKEGDLNNDEVWDVWRVEGPTFVSYFRGAPHVHAYINIGQKA